MAKTSHSGNGVTVPSPPTLYSSTVCNCHIILPCFKPEDVHMQKPAAALHAHISLWTQPLWLRAKLSQALPSFRIGQCALPMSLQWTRSLKKSVTSVYVAHYP